MPPLPRIVADVIRSTPPPKDIPLDAVEIEIEVEESEDAYALILDSYCAPSPSVSASVLSTAGKISCVNWYILCNASGSSG